MLEALPLGDAFLWWISFAGIDEHLDGPYTLVQEAAADQEGKPHPDGCGCPDCDPNGYAALMAGIEEEPRE